MFVLDTTLDAVEVLHVRVFSTDFGSSRTIKHIGLDTPMMFQAVKRPKPTQVEHMFLIFFSLLKELEDRI